MLGIAVNNRSTDIASMSHCQVPLPRLEKGKRSNQYGVR